MKRLIENYTFNSATRQIIIVDNENIILEKLLLITNMTDGEIIFNFADSTKTATVSGNIITLECDTTTMDNSDVLQIFIEDVSLPQIDFSNFFSTLRNLLSRLSFDALSQLRATAAITSLPTLSTVTTVGTVTTANTSFGDAGKVATQQLITQNVVSNSYNRHIVRT